MAYSAPRGTLDILPDKTGQWQELEQLLRTICANYNVKEIRTPIFEHTELFTRSVGDTTDVVTKEMYTFEDKKKRSITLRPEGTAGETSSMLYQKNYKKFIIWDQCLDMRDHKMGVNANFINLV